MPVDAKILDEVETWENIGNARFVLKRFSSKGDLVDEMIPGRKKFHVTTRERQLNMEMAADDESDPFSNGMFSPLRLLDSTEDAKEIAANPNLLGESEMSGLFKMRIDHFRKRLETVTNVVVLNRLLQVASECDAPLSKVEAIKARTIEVAPPDFVEQAPPEAAAPSSRPFMR